MQIVELENYKIRQNMQVPWILFSSYLRQDFHTIHHPHSVQPETHFSNTMQATYFKFRSQLRCETSVKCC